MVPTLILLAALACPPTPVVVRDADGGARTPLVVPSGDRAAVVLFVGVDCPISNGYGPQLKQLMADYGGRGVAFYAVYDDPAVTPATALAHAKSFGLSCPAVLDPHGMLAGRVGATVTPEVAVIDAAGRMAYRGRVDDRVRRLGQTAIRGHHARPARRAHRRTRRPVR